MELTGMQVLAGVTSVWAVAMALSPGLQIRRMLGTKSSEDVSVGYFLVLLVGFGLWVAYGLARRDPVLWVPNSIAALVGLATILTAMHYRKHD